MSPVLPLRLLLPVVASCFDLKRVLSPLKVESIVPVPEVFDSLVTT